MERGKTITGIIEMLKVRQRAWAIRKEADAYFDGMGIITPEEKTMIGG